MGVLDWFRRKKGRKLEEGETKKRKGKKERV